MRMLWLKSKEDGILGKGLLKIKRLRSRHLIFKPFPRSSRRESGNECEARAAESGRGHPKRSSSRESGNKYEVRAVEYGIKQ